MVLRVSGTRSRKALVHVVQVHMGSRGRGSQLVQEGESDSRVEEMEQWGESESRLGKGVG